MGIHLNREYQYTISEHKILLEDSWWQFQPMFTIDILDGYTPIKKASYTPIKKAKKYLNNWFLLTKIGRGDPQFSGRGHGMKGLKIGYQTNSWGNAAIDWLEYSTTSYSTTSDSFSAKTTSTMFLYENLFNNFIIGSGIGRLSQIKSPLGLQTDYGSNKETSFGFKFSIGYEFKIGNHFKIIPEYFANSSFQENIGFSGFILNIGWIN